MILLICINIRCKIYCDVKRDCFCYMIIVEDDLEDDEEDSEEEEEEEVVKKKI